MTTQLKMCQHGNKVAQACATIQGASFDIVVKVQPGDVVITFSDGIGDNLCTDEIRNVLWEGLAQNWSPGRIAHTMVFLSLIHI